MANASCKAATQNSVSSELLSLQLSTFRLFQSITATRYRNPFLIGMYVISEHQTWLGRLYV